jgi:signal transduction histidine kinase
MAEIDPDRMHQLLMNLVGNAIHHNPDGCAVHLSVHREGESALLQIADEGTGIPAHALPHIFERFYRVDTSRSREHGGTGLGLSIVQSLAEAHGGSVEAASIPGKGTTFTLK